MYANLSESTPQITNFFKAIEEWRSAYTYATFSYLGVRNSQNKLLLISARIILSGFNPETLKPRFKTGNIEAGQWRIDQNIHTIEKVLAALSSADGFNIEEIGTICISNNDIESLYVGDPILLHPEGLASGNRLSVRITVKKTTCYRSKRPLITTQSEPAVLSGPLAHFLA